MSGPLGSLVVLTDRRAVARAGLGLASTVRAVAGAGADAVVLREKDLPRVERRAVGRAVAAALADTPTGLVVASDVDLAVELGAVGVHLAQADPSPPADRPTTAGAAVVFGRSCHDRVEVRAAEAEGVDYVTVSPVFPSRSKPGLGPTLGPAGAAALLSGDPPAPPAYALGGVDAGNAAACLRAGLCGVAVMGEVMASNEPAARVEALRVALDRSGARVP